MRRNNFLYYEVIISRVEFADMSEITETYRDTITAMRKHFDRGGDWFKVGIEGKENWSYQGVEKYSPVWRLEFYVLRL